MTIQRTFSTREVAQMWNVSESTIKRWADSGELCCLRTPGGHRRFHLEDISGFQKTRGFEATGFLTTEKWEEPEIEESLNRKKFDKVHQLMLYLASQNQRRRVKDLLERLYMRGIGIVDLYDDVLLPVIESSEQALQKGELTLAHEKLVKNNLDEAMALLFPQLIRRRQSGKTGLCAAADDSSRISVNAISRILETEGWDCLNLGGNVPFGAMAEMVEHEPVNLVCVVGSNQELPGHKKFETLSAVANNYRIPIVLTGPGFADPEILQQFSHDEYFPNFRSFQSYILRLS
jgi:excisionase family DNA binding protein